MTIFYVSETQLKELHTTQKRAESDQIFAQLEEFLSKLKAHYRKLKIQVKSLIDTTTNRIEYERQIIQLLAKYEERTNGFIDSQTKTDSKQQAHLQSGILTQEMVRRAVSINLGNPYTPILYYIKGEISDIKAMEQTIQQRQNLIKMVPQIVSKRQTVALELQDKIQGGFTVSFSTLRTMFKSSQEKEEYNQSLAREIERLKLEEDSCLKLASIADYVLCQQIDTFKQNKLDELARVIREMSQCEIDNSNNTAQYFSALLSSHPNLKLASA